MNLNLILFTLIQIVPLFAWQVWCKRNNQQVDWRLVLSYFVVGSWFGMLGELFIYHLVDLFLSKPIWEYRLWPIYNGVISAYGPVMWGMAGLYICFHRHYPLIKRKKKSLGLRILNEAMYLMVLEVLFNFIAFGLFDDFYFYYYTPDLWHWTSLTNLPLWWIGYHVVAKLASVFYKEEKIALGLAFLIIVVVLGYGK